MKKKYFLFALILALIVSAVLIRESVAAEVYNTEHVFDFADLLTDNEEEDLREFAEKYEEYELSVIFVTTQETGGSSSRDYSDNFYDTSNFRPNGVLFMIDMYNREIYINTVGTCIDRFSDLQISQALDGSYKHATAGEYALCLTRMSRSICDIIDEQENPIETALKPNFLTVFLMIVVAATVLIVLIVKHNKANVKVSARHYIGSSFRVKNRDTVFMGCRKEVIPDYYAQPKDSGTGGGSSSHISSGGVSHGGGGHKF